MKYDLLKDFELYSKVSEELIKKYEGKIPEQFITIWKNYGFGTFYNGYYKLINPEEYIAFVEHSYFEKNNIPLLVTALGDIIVWERSEYLYILFYRYNTFNSLCRGCDFFFDDILDELYIKDRIKPVNFIEALKNLGTPAYDECFGYVPLLSLGGPEKTENLQKVKLREHLELMLQMQGGI